jgi:hypothetical protein
MVKQGTPSISHPPCLSTRLNQIQAVEVLYDENIPTGLDPSYRHSDS